MAYTTFGNTAASSATLRDRVLARLDMVRTQWGQWRTYRTTFNELSALSNRDLADLGLNRGEIRAVSLEAAYGK